jgi:hypothetical protein
VRFLDLNLPIDIPKIQERVAAPLLARAPNQEPCRATEIQPEPIARPTCLMSDNCTNIDQEKQISAAC